jgi:hypothetical protein
MNRRSIFILIPLLLLVGILNANERNVRPASHDPLLRDTSLHRHWKPENQKLVASILAFPVPFGMLGLHRIYLGTEPWVPVVYICTLGGAGLIATIDFIVIASSDPEELKQYEHNPKVFMWVK